MPDCNATTLHFAPFKRRQIEAEFSGGDVSSDGGVLLLRQLERRLGLLERAAAVLSDPRDPERITHSVTDMLKQRVFGLCLGYEDLNDHGELRHLGDDNRPNGGGRRSASDRQIGCPLFW